MKSLLKKWLIGTVSLLLLCGPGFAYLLGARAGSIENRAVAPAPNLSDGWNVLRNLGPFLSDRLPLRSNAIRIDAFIDQQVFSEDPTFGVSANPRVIMGKLGFLFLADAIDNACLPNLDPTTSANHFAKLAKTISASGRKVAMLVAPDKSTVHPELLPDGMLKRKCFDDHREQLWRSLRNENIIGFIDLRSLLVSSSKSSRQPLYLRKDSHWDSAGSLLAVREIVKQFDSVLWDRAEVKQQERISYQGDLTGLRGIPESDTAPLLEIKIPNSKVTSSQRIGATDFDENKRVRRTSSVPLIKGRTLFLLDSFGLAALPQLEPFFEDLTTFRLSDFQPELIKKLILDADNVIIMSVERSLGYRMLAEIGSPEFVKDLSEELVDSER